ncbi:MAG TPA: SDR family NAD(P)-dependent oxidoreductase [Blastococcus sp.]|jgi:3-oxoacyl-[acyl-carrier protein] reductase|nr:SDR family NAD(P)-dependent oxidoreductase [Blastococcus sp.]
MNRLSGRRVIVTGGAQGIGAAIVRTFAAEGASVMVLDGCAEAAALLAEEAGGGAYVVDLTDARATRDAMEHATDRLGGLDVLVNNAGVMRFSALLDMESSDLGEVFDMGTRTMLITTQLAARAMIGFRTPSGECVGKIINVAGTSGTGGGGPAHFAASKAAVMALTRAAAHELGAHGITVNCLCPGYVLDRREMAGAGRGHVAEWSALSPLGRLGEPQDVARAALFLASSDSDYLTGDALNVAGGMSLH